MHKLLLTPTERLKTAADEATAAQYAEAITQLFSLGDDQTTEAPDPAASAPPTPKTPVTS